MNTILQRYVEHGEKTLTILCLACKWVVHNLAAFTTSNGNSPILSQRMKSKAAVDVFANRRVGTPLLEYGSKSFLCYSAQLTMYTIKPMPYHGSGDLDAGFLQWSLRFNPSWLHCRLVVGKQPLKQVAFQIPSVSPYSSSLRHCSVLIHHHSLRHATALTRQHIITSSAINLGHMSPILLSPWLVTEKGSEVLFPDIKVTM